jgi:hypothetical protein
MNKGQRSGVRKAIENEKGKKKGIVVANNEQKKKKNSG